MADKLPGRCRTDIWLKPNNCFWIFDWELCDLVLHQCVSKQLQSCLVKKNITKDTLFFVNVLGPNLLVDSASNLKADVLSHFINGCVYVWHCKHRWEGKSSACCEHVATQRGESWFSWLVHAVVSHTCWRLVAPGVTLLSSSFPFSSSSSAAVASSARYCGGYYRLLG